MSSPNVVRVTRSRDAASVQSPEVVTPKQQRKVTGVNPPTTSTAKEKSETSDASHHNESGSIIRTRATGSQPTELKDLDAPPRKKTEASLTSVKKRMGSNPRSTATPEKDVEVNQPAETPPLKRRRMEAIEAPASKGGLVSQDSQNDAYCWICHREGKVLCCEVCPRVCHMKCLGLDSDPVGEWVCPECQKVMTAECVDTRSKSMCMISHDQLCSLLKYALHRMRHQGSEPFEEPVDLNMIPTYRDYVFYPMDLETIDKNIKKKMYGSTEAFLADVKWVQHNCIIFNGTQSKLTNSAKMIVKICKHEMSEIEICPDCYMNSSIKRNDNWFCEPCRTPHPLVWSKLKGYPFWPAKALREVDGQVDVRFFGAHDRSWVPVSQCYMLSEECPTPVRKKTAGFDAAMEELEQHIKKISEKFGDFEYAPFRTPYDEKHVYMKNKLKSPKVPGSSFLKKRKMKSKSPDVCGIKQENDDGDELEGHSSVALKSTAGRFSASLRQSLRGDNPVTKTPDKVSAVKAASALKNKYSSIATSKRTITKNLCFKGGVPRLLSTERMSVGEHSSSETAAERNTSTDQDLSTSSFSKAKSPAREIIRNLEEKIQNLNSDGEMIDMDEQENQCDKDSASVMGKHSTVPENQTVINNPLDNKTVQKIQANANEVASDFRTDSNSPACEVSSTTTNLDERSTAKAVSDLSETSDLSKPGGQEYLENLEKTIASCKAKLGISGDEATCPVGEAEDDEHSESAKSVGETSTETDDTSSESESDKETANKATEEPPGDTSVETSKNLQDPSEDKVQDPSKDKLETFETIATEHTSQNESEKKDDEILENSSNTILEEEKNNANPDLSRTSAVTEEKSSDYKNTHSGAVPNAASQDIVAMETESESDNDRLVIDVPADCKKKDRNEDSKEKSPEKTMSNNSSSSDSSKTILKIPSPDRNFTKISPPDKKATKKLATPSVDSLLETKLEKLKTINNNTEENTVKESSILRSVKAVQISPIGVNPSKLEKRTSLVTSPEIRELQNMTVGGASGLGRPKGGAMNSGNFAKQSEQSFEFSKYQNLMSESVNKVMQDLCSDMSSHMKKIHLPRPSIEVELRSLQWRHQQEMAELMHNCELTLSEMRAAFQIDKQHTVADLKKQHKKELEQVILETKRKQWCANCGKEAIFYCCWNTSYCDYPCQQAHWPQHMTSCTQSVNQSQESSQHMPGKPATETQPMGNVQQPQASAADQWNLEKTRNNFQSALRREAERQEHQIYPQPPVQYIQTSPQQQMMSPNNPSMQVQYVQQVVSQQPIHMQPTMAINSQSRLPNPNYMSQQQRPMMMSSSPRAATSLIYPALTPRQTMIVSPVNNQRPGIMRGQLPPYSRPY